MRARIIGVLALLAASGCAASAPGPAGDDPGGPDGGGPAPDGGDIADAEVLDGADFGDGSGRGCSPDARLVYVIDYGRNLHRFDPATLEFSDVGQIDCTDQSIFSMAVNRDAVAWVLALDGTMVRYDIPSLACKPVAFPSGQHGFLTFGMGFSSNSKGGDDETLFVSSASNLGLASVDTQTLALTPVGAYDTLQGRVELTGTGDGQLFGAFEGSPYVVAEIAKDSAKIVSEAPQDAIVPPTGGSNFAFAFWGGDFWLFVGPGGDATDVFRYRPADGTTTLVAQVDFQIVGAGVSTCAPTTRPL